MSVMLTDWLTAHPSLAQAIVWEKPGGAVHPWSTWNSGLRNELQVAFDKAVAGLSIPIADVPANKATPVDTDRNPSTVLAESHAWKYFKASIGQSLALETGSLVSWSIAGATAARLAQLFNSREMFHWDANHVGYRIDSSHGRALPASPRKCYEFLRTNNLVADTALKTIGRLLDWCRSNLIHFAGAFTTKNCEDQWQYRGYPPVARVLDGTVRTSTPASGVRHRTAGCRGTCGFIRLMLRTVNIPVKMEVRARHAMPWFMREQRYLSHGDDPYNELIKRTPPIPAGKMLIDAAKFESWFGPDVSEQVRKANVGRRVLELANEYPL